jgi:hypothetical protein
MIREKIIFGYIVQQFDDDKCMSQDFVNADDEEVKWQDHMGSDTKPIKHDHCPYDMVQPEGYVYCIVCTCMISEADSDSSGGLCPTCFKACKGDNNANSEGS